MAAETEMEWTAQSRGLAVERGSMNIGPISPHALNVLATKGMRLKDPIRYPKSVSNDDMRNANRIIALDEKEHRILIEERFPLWADLVTYWSIKDVEELPPDQALSQLELEISFLIKQLRNSPEV